MVWKRFHDFSKYAFLPYFSLKMTSPFCQFPDFVKFPLPYRVSQVCSIFILTLNPRQPASHSHPSQLVPDQTWHLHISLQIPFCIHIPFSRRQTRARQSGNSGETGWRQPWGRNHPNLGPRQLIPKDYHNWEAPLASPPPAAPRTRTVSPSWCMWGRPPEP